MLTITERQQEGSLEKFSTDLKHSIFKQQALLSIRH